MYINQISCNQEQNIYTVSVVLNFFYKFVFIFVMASHLTVIVRLRIGQLYRHYFISSLSCETIQ